jgi:hypothetical protein
LGGRNRHDIVGSPRLPSKTYGRSALEMSVCRSAGILRWESLASRATPLPQDDKAGRLPSEVTSGTLRVFQFGVLLMAFFRGRGHAL